MSSRWFRLALPLVAAVVLVAVLVPRLREAWEPWEPPTFEESDAVSREPGDGLPPRTPNPWFYTERAYPLGHIDLANWHRAQLQATALRAEAAAKGDRTAWELRGPTNIGGRITDIAVDPRSPQVAFAGAAEGGVLRTRDGGQSWTPLLDDQAALSVGAVCLDPQDPDVVYAGTGEVNPGGGSVAYGGVGVLRSLDGGDSWQPLGLENAGSIGRLVVDPTDSQRIFAAVMGHLWLPGPDRGVYRTTDGGSTWQQVLYVDDTTGAVDIIVRPDDPQVILAAMWQRIRTPELYDYGGPGCAVWRSDDGGDTWQIVGGGLPTPGTDSGRIGLTLCAAQPDRMYAVYADRTGYFAGLYRSNDGGATWTRTSDGALSSVFASYGWWFGNVRCHPTDPNTVFVLGLDFFRTTNGGSSWSEVSDGMHVDHHALAFSTGLTPVIYEGNDGGLYRSNNGGSAWAMLPDQPITQVYRLALDAQNPDALYLGGQDISTVRTLTGALDDWSTIFGGDGFQPLVHRLNGDRIWAQFQYGSVYYSSNGGQSFSYAGSGISGSDRVAWNAPHVQDPTDTERRYFGTSRLYRNSGNTSWTAISGDLTGGPHHGQSGQVDGTLTAIGVSPIDGQVIWTGSDDGRVHVTTSGGGTWTDVSAGLPDRWVTSVHSDPFVRETAYVTVSGFRWNEPLPHVYRTTDLGATWQPIAGNLPEAPTNDLLPSPELANRLYVATDVGVYETHDGGTTWQVAGSGLPRVVVTELDWSAARHEIVASTFGRSAWSLPVSGATAVGDDIAVGHGGALGRVLAPFPNPASDGTRIQWELASSRPVTVDVITVAGRRVRTLRTDAAAGRGGLDWDGHDDGGHPVASGVYLLRVLSDGEAVGTRTVVLRR